MHITWLLCCWGSVMAARSQANITELTLWEGLEGSPGTPVEWHQRSLRIPFKALEHFNIPISPQASFALSFRPIISEDVVIYDMSVSVEDLGYYMSALKKESSSVDPHIVWISFRPGFGNDLTMRVAIQKSKEARQIQAFKQLMKILDYGSMDSKSDVPTKKQSLNLQLKPYPESCKRVLALPLQDDQYYPLMAWDATVKDNISKPYFPQNSASYALLHPAACPNGQPLNLQKYLVVEDSLSRADATILSDKRLDMIGSGACGSLSQRLIGFKTDSSFKTFDLIFRHTEMDNHLNDHLYVYLDRPQYHKMLLNGQVVPLNIPESDHFMLNSNLSLMKIQRNEHGLEAIEVLETKREEALDVSPHLTPDALFVWLPKSAINFLFDPLTMAAYTFKEYENWEDAKADFLKCIEVFASVFTETGYSELLRSVQIQPTPNGTFRVAMTGNASNSADGEAFGKMLHPIEFSHLSLVNVTTLI